MQRNLKWYIRLFLVLLLSVLLFVSLFFMVYTQSIAQIRQEAVQRQQTYLQRGAQEIASAFSAYWGNGITQLRKLGTLTSIAGLRVIEPSDYAKMISLRNEIDRIVGGLGMGNPFLLIIDQGDGLAISSQSIYHNLRESIDEGIVKINALPYEETLSFIRKQANDGAIISKASVIQYVSSADGLYSHSNKRFLCVVRNLQLGSARASAYALWLYDIDVLRGTLSGESQTNDFFALRRRDNVIYTNMPDAPLNLLEDSIYYDASSGDTYFSMPLPSLGLTAYLSLNDEVVLQHMQRFTLLWNILLAAFGVLCAVLVALVIVYLVKPLHRLYDRMFSGVAPDAQPGGNIFAQMEGRFQELGLHQEEQARMLVRWQGLLHKQLLHKLLLRGQLSPTEAGILGNLPAIMPDQVFRVALVGVFSESPQLQAEFEAKAEAMLGQAQSAPLYAWIDVRHVALILPESPATLQAAQASQTHALLDSLFSALSGQLSDPDALAIGVGLGHADIKNVDASYREALHAFREAAMWRRAAIVYYDADSAGLLRYSIPYDELEKLQNLLEAGNAAEACALLDTLARQVFDPEASAQYDPVVRNQFYHDIYGMVLRISSRRREMSILSSFPAYEGVIPLQTQLSRIKSSIQYIAEIMSSNKDADNTLSASLLRYIMTYYNDPAMSVTTVAEAFSMSERSLSRYFKDKMEDTFSNVLEKLRLSEAETLLLRGGVTMKEIAQQVGYANMTTFLKAFKRRYGVSPSDWVRKNQESAGRS